MNIYNVFSICPLIFLFKKIRESENCETIVVILRLEFERFVAGLAVNFFCKIKIISNAPRAMLWTIDVGTILAISS